MNIGVRFRLGIAILAVTTIGVLFLTGCQNSGGGGSGPGDITVIFTDLTANGSATATTTELTLTFNQDIAGLSAADITLEAGSTGAVKGTLTRIGTGIYELAVGGISSSGSVTVAVSKSGYNITGGSKTAAVYHYTAPTDISAAFIYVTADGSNMATTTKLTLVFDKDITGLSAVDIALDGGSTGASKGSLTRTGTGVYDLAISGITAGGRVIVAVSKSGYNITGGSKTVTIYHYTAPTDISAAFTDLTADGSNMATTTKLTLVFDKDIAGLKAADIALDGGSTGASKGSLTRTGTGVYDLAISGITSTGSVTMAVSKPGYNITDESKTVMVYCYTAPTDISVVFTGISADGSNTATTTKLILTFDRDIDGLIAADIALDSGFIGASKGSLTRTGTGVYDLAISGITVGGSVSVAVSKPGYNITGGSKTVMVYHYIAPTDISVVFTNLTADGSIAVTTTKLTLTFDKDINGLNAADIALDGGSTGASKGSLARTGTGIYDLAVSGIGSNGSVTVAVSKPGYNITGELGVMVYHYTAPTDISVTFTNLTADGSTTVTTTKLTLTFDKDITGLSAADIALDGGFTGATKGSLTRTGTGVYELMVSGITTGGSVTVAVSKPGYNIIGGSKTVTVYYRIITFTVDPIPSQTYTGSAITPTITVKDGSTTLALNTHYTVSYSNNTNAGTATVTISGTGSYAGISGSAAFTILQTVSPDRIEYYWVDQHDSLVTTSGGAITVASGTTLTITAQSAGYTVKQWHLDGVNTGQSGNTYNFSSVITGKHTIGLFVEKGGNLYNTNIAITVVVFTIFNEDFEGTTHSFTIVNGTQTNQWYVGTAAKYEGAKSAYISNNSGTSNAYTITSTSTVHMYRDVTFPSSASPYTLTFYWRAEGEGSSTRYDYLRVLLTETYVTPAAGSSLPDSNTVLGTYNLGGAATWKQASISIPATTSGTTKRLVFTWRNDNSGGTQPPVAVDNIVLTK